MRTVLYRCDRQQSVLALADNSKSYPPYGALIGSPRLLLAYCGQLIDPVTFGYLLGNGARGYSPQLMRFSSPDTLSPFATGGINAYAYCGGDPVNYHDPDGHDRSLVTRVLQSYGIGKTAVLTKYVEAAVHMVQARGTRGRATPGDWAALAVGVSLDVANTALSVHAALGYSPLGNSIGKVSGLDNIRGYYRPYRMSTLGQLEQNALYNTVQFTLAVVSTAVDFYAGARLIRFTDQWAAPKRHPAAFEELRSIRIDSLNALAPSIHKSIASSR